MTHLFSGSGSFTEISPKRFLKPKIFRLSLGRGGICPLGWVLLPTRHRKTLQTPFTQADRSACSLGRGGICPLGWVLLPTRHRKTLQIPHASRPIGLLSWKRRDLPSGLGFTAYSASQNPSNPSRKPTDRLALLEEEGFEPPIPVKVYLVSNQTHSATLPLFHVCRKSARVAGCLLTRKASLF